MWDGHPARLCIRFIRCVIAYFDSAKAEITDFNALAKGWGLLHCVSATRRLRQRNDNYQLTNNH
ncbi:hypothetical protein OSCI_2530027 [Kamptonema sp. PCC 6506]|nr:hypothetical protein OSCI_2530027 [Kamptonema sp. PCC 6506]